MTAAEVLIDRLIDWGVEVIFGLPGDGINGIMEALYSSGEDPLYPGAARGIGCIHGVRIREIHWQARRMSCHVRSGWDSPVERPLRCQARPSASPSHHWIAVSRFDWHAHAAGRRPR